MALKNFDKWYVYRPENYNCPDSNCVHQRRCTSKQTERQYLAKFKYELLLVQQHMGIAHSQTTHEFDASVFQLCWGNQTARSGKIQRNTSDYKS